LTTFQDLHLNNLPKVPSHNLPDEVNRLKLVEHSIACPFLIQQLSKKNGEMDRLGIKWAPFILFWAF
jgi:hypothetical protein